MIRYGISNTGPDSVKTVQCELLMKKEHGLKLQLNFLAALVNFSETVLVYVNSNLKFH